MTADAGGLSLHFDKMAMACCPGVVFCRVFRFLALNDQLKQAGRWNSVNLLTRSACFALAVSSLLFVGEDGYGIDY